MLMRRVGENLQTVGVRVALEVVVLSLIDVVYIAQKELH